MPASGDEQTRVGVTKVMKPDLREAGRGQVAMIGGVERVRVERPAGS